MKRRLPRGFVDIMPNFKVGDPPPVGYLEWHEWARIQLQGGLRQKRCPMCGLFRFPMETCAHPGAPSAH